MKYFAYGANMDPVGMARRCPTAEVIGPAILRDHALCFRWWRRWRTGVAHVEASEGSMVWGVLWEIGPEDERRLDRYEDLARGLYTKATVTVETAEVPHEAMAYVATGRIQKRPSRRYLRLLVRGAEAYGAPPAYVEALRAFRP